jgi:hypothetical protein
VTHREFQTLHEYDEALRETVALIGKGDTTRVDVSGKLEKLIIESVNRDVRQHHRGAERRREQLELSLRQIDEGFGREDGYFPDVAHLFPYLGLVKLEERLAALRKEREALAADLAYDPTVTRAYRVCGIKPGSPRAAINVYWYFGSVLRKLAVGDVIQLNARKAAEYADFLEPVEDEHASSAPPDTPASPTSAEASATS